jgi:hypothetical protein
MTKAQKTKLKELAWNADIMARVVKDALEHGDKAMSYIEDVVNNGCQSGSCNDLVYMASTNEFYNQHKYECEEIFHEYERETGEGFKFEGRDIRNTLAWMAYEERARQLLEVLEEVENEKVNEN